MKRDPGPVPLIPDPDRAPVTMRVNRTGWWFLLAAAMGVVSHGVAFLIGVMSR